MKLKGISYYSSTTKKATKGKYPSNCYEVGLGNIEITQATEQERKWLEEFIPSHIKVASVKDNETEEFIDVDVLKIANSKYEIPMFDMEGNRLPQAVPVSNGTPITIAVDKRHSSTYNVDYLVVKAIQVNTPIVEFNPFK